MVSKQKIINNLKNDTFARLSCTTYGVGLVAIKDIPKNTMIFKTSAGHCRSDDWTELTEKEIRKLPKSVQEYVYDFGAVSGKPVENKGPAVVPVMGLNTLDVTNFFNHSDKPNCVAIRDTKCFMTFKSRRKIRKGEELSYDYAAFF